MEDSLHNPGCFVRGSRNLPEPPFSNPTTTVHDQVTHACRRLPDISFTHWQVPLTSLPGAEFVKAWLEVVKSHAFLWSQNIKYYDQTIWNTMYDKSLKSPVLVDYDVSIISPDFVPRTVMSANPFTALSLLSKAYRDGKIEREYRHELEAFIWILCFVFLGYQNGSRAQESPLVDDWMPSKYSNCCFQKHMIWSSMLPDLENYCQSDYKDHVKLAEGLLFWMARMDYVSNPSSRRVHQNQDLPLINISNDLTSIWPAFVEQLRSVAKSFSSKLGYIDELVDDLGLESPIWVSNTKASAKTLA